MARKKQKTKAEYEELIKGVTGWKRVFLIMWHAHPITSFLIVGFVFISLLSSIWLIFNFSYDPAQPKGERAKVTPSKLEITKEVDR